jgi:hypothetical protein
MGRNSVVWTLLLRALEQLRKMKLRRLGKQITNGSLVDGNLKRCRFLREAVFVLLRSYILR